MLRGIADERDSADRTVTPTGNKTKMNGFVEISTLLIHSAPKQKSNEWMHLSPFYTRMHGEWLRYAKSTSQFHWRFLLVRDVRGFQVNPLCRHDITRSDRQITLPLTQHAMHCTLTPFNWTTRTHCTNTTYLLSLDTIRCTSTTLHMNNLLHLCTSICCSTNLLLIYNLLHLTLLLCIDHIMYRYCT